VVGTETDVVVDVVVAATDVVVVVVVVTVGVGFSSQAATPARIPTTVADASRKRFKSCSSEP
jgi:hypothetical protein